MSQTNKCPVSTTQNVFSSEKNDLKKIQDLSPLVSKKVCVGASERD
jgi:hypothetical protein